MAFASAHRRQNSGGSTDSSLGSLSLSPGFNKLFPHLPVERRAVREGEDSDSWLSSAPSLPFREFEEAESPPSSAPVSPSIVPRRGVSFAETPRTPPDDERGRKADSDAAAPERRTSAPRGDEHRRLPDTWQGMVEAAARAAAREGESEELRMTRSSSMPNNVAYRPQGHAPGMGTGRFASIGGEGTGRGGRKGFTVSAEEPTVGSAYHQLFSKRGRSPSAARSTEEAKGRFAS